MNKITHKLYFKQKQTIKYMYLTKKKHIYTHMYCDYIDLHVSINSTV